MDLLTRYLVDGGVLTRRTGVSAPVGTFTAFAIGAVKPIGVYDTGTRNVGPRIPTTPFVGNVTIAAGQVVSGLEIFGTVKFSGTGTLRDCIVHGPVSGPTPLVALTASVPTRTNDPLSGGAQCIGGTTSFNLQGSLIEWTRIDAIGYDSVFLDGIGGGNFTAQYCEIYGTVDGIGMLQIGNGKIYNSRIARGFYSAYLDPATGNPIPGFPTSPSDRTTHSDGIQIHQFGGWEIKGNNIGGAPYTGGASVQAANRDPTDPVQLAVIQAVDAQEGYSNSAIIVNTTAPNITAAVIDKNWIQGGAAGINLLGASASDPMTGVIVTNNRFIQPQTGYYIVKNALFGGTVSGNVFDSTGNPVTVSSVQEF